MFVIVWFWVFPVFVLPIVVPLTRGTFMRTIPEFFYDAISRSYNNPPDENNCQTRNPETVIRIGFSLKACI